MVEAAMMAFTKCRNEGNLDQKSIKLEEKNRVFCQELCYDYECIYLPSNQRRLLHLKFFFFEWQKAKLIASERETSATTMFDSSEMKCA